LPARSQGIDEVSRDELSKINQIQLQLTGQAGKEIISSRTKGGAANVRALRGKTLGFSTVRNAGMK
jgi:hypothetical protein